MLYTVDRIEENIAVLYDEEENQTDIPVCELPENVKESDILRFDAENNEYIIEIEQTAQVKADLEERLQKLLIK